MAPRYCGARNFAGDFIGQRPRYVALAFGAFERFATAAASLPTLCVRHGIQFVGRFDPELFHGLVGQGLRGPEVTAGFPSGDRFAPCMRRAARSGRQRRSERAANFPFSCYPSGVSMSIGSAGSYGWAVLVLFRHAMLQIVKTIPVMHTRLDPWLTNQRAPREFTGHALAGDGAIPTSH